MERAAIWCWEKRSLLQLLIPSSPHPAAVAFQPTVLHTTPPQNAWNWLSDLTELRSSRVLGELQVKVKTRLDYIPTSILAIPANLVGHYVYLQNTFPWRILSHPPLSSPPLKFSLFCSADKYCLRNIFVSFYFWASVPRNSGINPNMWKARFRAQEILVKYEKDNSSNMFPLALGKNSLCYKGSRSLFFTET